MRVPDRRCACMVASSRRTAICSVFERSISSRSRSGSSLMLSSSPCFAGRELDLGLFLVGLGERHLAFLDRAMQQQPGRELHQPRGQPHAFGGIGERGDAIELLGFLPARTVEIGSRSPRPAPCRRETDRRRPANSRASRRKTRARPRPIARTSRTPHARNRQSLCWLRQPPGGRISIARRTPRCPASVPRSFRHSCRRATPTALPHRVPAGAAPGCRPDLTRNGTAPGDEQKRAAVAGGSKV